MNTLTQYLNKLEAVANAATEGPWHCAAHHEDLSVDKPVIGWDVLDNSLENMVLEGMSKDPFDAELAAQARTAIPKLVKIVRHLFEEHLRAEPSVNDLERVDREIQAILEGG